MKDPTPRRSLWSSEHRFYLGVALVVVSAVLVGFSRSFFLRPLFPRWESPHETIFYVHGALFASWCALLVAQTLLVAGGRVRVHRRVGRWGVALAAGMLVIGVYGALTAARRPTGFVGVDVPPLQFLAVPLADIALFAAFVGVAVAARRDPQAHKRWMVLATISLIDAAVARWPGVISVPSPYLAFGLTDLFVVALAVWDIDSRGRLHRATVVGGLLLVASQPLRLAVSDTSAWLAFARWATGLLG